MKRFLTGQTYKAQWLLIGIASLLLLGACRAADQDQNPVPTGIPGSTPDGAGQGLNTRPSTPLPAQTPVLETQPPPTLLSPSPTALPATEPAQTPTPEFPEYEGQPLERANMGVQVHIHREDISQIIDHINRLGVGWVKVQVSWKLYQPGPDRYDEERFAELDKLINVAQENDLQVLLSVSKAPEWSRPTTEMDGPPGDYNLYSDFLRFLGSRYLGRVAAYELWNEPNLQREWNGLPLGAADFVSLVAAGAAGLRQSDTQSVIISGAPAVTGINDGILAIDDRVFLRGMLEAGIADHVHAIGVHPYGWANPPDSSVSSPDRAISSHNNHPSFFFKDTLADYEALLDQYGVEMQLWATEFGWGSFEGVNNKLGTPEPPPDHALFMNEVSEWQQAIYILRAFSMAQEMDSIGPMFLWNLNFGPLLGTQFSESGYSLLRPDGSQRPSYLSLQHAAKE